MLCPVDEQEMRQDNVIVNATAPSEDDCFPLMWICDACGHQEPIINEEGDND